MHRNEHTIEIARPPAAVFPYLTEPELLKRWVGGLTTFEAVDGESALCWRPVPPGHGHPRQGVEA